MRVLLTCLVAILLVGAAAGAEPVAPLPVTEVAEGVFVAVGPHELATPANADHISNASFVVGGDAVAVIDTGGSFVVGRRLLAAIRARTERPIRYVINTHDHPDHVFGNAAFLETGAAIVGHWALPDALAERADVYLGATRDLIGAEAFTGTRAIPPTVLVRDRLTLDLGGRRLILEAWPAAHTNTDLTVLDERTGTWLLGDLLFSGHVPALDGSLKGWLAVIETLKTRTVARAVPGHGPAVMPWPQALEPMERYLRTLAADVRRAIRDGRTMQQAAEAAALSERSRWALFDDFNARNAIAAYHELEWE